MVNMKDYYNGLYLGLYLGLVLCGKREKNVLKVSEGHLVVRQI